jgi:glycosyltransferase involved in cell wall biosynthesis
MKVSVATISLNQVRFLREAIESVLAQAHSEVEYIVVDAGSTDGSRELIEEYRDRIAHVVFEADDGPADGLNKALRIASGDIWGCVNADDLLLAHAASSAVRVFESDPSLDVAYADGYIVDANSRVLRRERSDGFSARRYAYGIGIVVQQSTFIRRRAALGVGGYNTSNRTCWDGEVLLDLAIAGSRMRHVDDVWGMFRIHPASITGSGRAADQYEVDRRRLFWRAIGRPWRRTDAATVLAARGLKALANAVRAGQIDASAAPSVAARRR